MITKEIIRGGQHPVKDLGTVVDFLDNLRRPITASDRIPGPYPYYGANGQQDSVVDYIFNEPLILLAEDGGFFDEPDRGIAYAIEGKTWVNNHAHVLRPHPNIELRYLLRVLENYDVTPWLTGSTRQKLTKSGASKIQIPLPPLPEQKRIAAILDAADAMRAKRRESLRQLDLLLQSTFLDMFGDPTRNPKGWDVKPLGHGVNSFEGGKNLMPTEDERADGIRVLKVSAVTSGEYRPEESKSFSNDEVVPTHQIVRRGDLLISRANTAALVGAVCYVWKTNDLEMLPDKIWRFVWNKDKRIDPLFMLHMARSAYFREQLIQRATGTSGSMKNIGKSKMLEIPIPLPPLDLQNRFATIVEAVEKQKDLLRAHLAELDTLFASLQHRAFNGEL